MILKSSRFWKPVILLFLVDLILLAVAAFWSATHWEGGNGTWLVIAFPLAIPFQWTVYGVVLGIGNYRNKLIEYATVLAILHVTAVVVNLVVF